MALKAPKAVSKALILLFDGFNTLDVNGPLEVLRKSGSSTIIEVSIGADSNSATPTVSVEGAHIKATVNIDDSFIKDQLDDYDILVVPGAPGDRIVAQLKHGLDTPFFAAIKKFASLGPRKDNVEIPRILLSICTGALFLGTLGLFNEVGPFRKQGISFCTSHFGVYGMLQSTNDRFAQDHGQKAGARVLPARYVDAGLNNAGVRVISSGGISCGMDASLHVVKLRGDLLLVGQSGTDYAKGTAEMLDYRWETTCGVTIDNTYQGPSMQEQMSRASR